MNTEKHRKTELILNSLDGCQPAAAPDFFYTRLKARMLARHESLQGQSISDFGHGWKVRPVFALAAIVLVLLVNVFVILQKNDSPEIISQENDSAQSIAAEYNLNDTNPIYDLNQEK